MELLSAISAFILDPSTLANEKRDEARQTLRDWLTDRETSRPRIYIGRRPQDNDQNGLSLQLEYAGGINYYSLLGEIDAAWSNVQATFRLKETTGNRAQRRVGKAVDSLQLLLSGYRGTLRDELDSMEIETIVFDGKTDFTERPIDGSDRHTIALGVVLQVYHEQESTIGG